jgi:hypothetical protein
MSVYFVYLRQPKDMNDRRNDPFWEFGSFGKTGCHRKNLLHPKNSHIKDGDQLAFLQGGAAEIRVVGLSPSLRVAGSLNQIELTWDKTYRPLPYLSAPLLINNARESAFPAVFAALRLRDTNRTTFCGAAASRLRSRSTEVSHELSQEIIRWFAAPRLPRISIYPQSIQSESETWYQCAIRQGWASASERASQYKRAGMPKCRHPGSQRALGKPKRCC